MRGPTHQRVGLFGREFVPLIDSRDARERSADVVQKFLGYRLRDTERGQVARECPAQIMQSPRRNGLACDLGHLGIELALETGKVRERLPPPDREDRAV